LGMFMRQNGFQWSKQLPFGVFSVPNHCFCCPWASFLIYALHATFDRGLKVRLFARHKLAHNVCHQYVA
jgi:hypothetical protein